jgi:Ca2+-binding RTX toxin-like protein
MGGGGGHDTLDGGPGNDRLVSDPRGGDSLYGGPGDDTLITRNGAIDSANGGGGRDRARVDPADYVRYVEVLF